VVVTRARTQASTLVDRLVALGADVVELPVIAIGTPADGGEALGERARRAAGGEYEWVVFTSANAVDPFFDAFDAAAGTAGAPLSVPRWAAVGPATARALAGRGRPADLVPSSAVAEALADEFPAAGASARPVLFPRAETVRDVLARGLRAKGWVVDEVVAYRTVGSEPTPEALAEARTAEAIAFTSTSTVERTVGLLGADGLPPVVVTIGPVTSAAVRGAGSHVDREAGVHDVAGLVDAVVAAVADRRGATDRGRRRQQREHQQEP
jgi:uroporphyrinogen III methyltransferase/synthase